MAFEKYIKDCVVDFQNPYQGSGFFVLPTRYLLTCYHVIDPAKFHKDSNIPIAYRKKIYHAQLEHSLSRKDLDIAVLVVKDFIDEIHFVPLGDPELNTEVHVFGYRADEEKVDGFKNGYHVSGMLRPGQRVREKGQVYNVLNLETNQPENSSLNGMSGSPVYDLNKRKVIGLQFGEGESPSICYVHPITRVYDIWPGLRISNRSISKTNFNINTHSSVALHQIIISVIISLLQLQVEEEVRKNFDKSTTLTQVEIQKIKDKIIEVISTTEGIQELINVALRAEELFRKKCNNEDLCDAFYMPDSLAPSIILDSLKQFARITNYENAKFIVRDNLRLEFPELATTLVEEGAERYLNCLIFSIPKLKAYIYSLLAHSHGSYEYLDQVENKIERKVLGFEDDVDQMGIAEILDHINAKTWPSIDEQDPDTQIQLSNLENLLKQEGSHLHGWRKIEWPTYFLQQIYNRVLQIKSPIILKTCEKLLIERREPWLAEQFPTKNLPINYQDPPERHFDKILGLVFTMDGKHVISASSDHTLRLWNVDSGQTARIFKEHSENVLGVALDPDGKHFYSVSSDQEIRYWNINSEHSLKVFTPRFRGEETFLWCISLASNDNVLLGSSDNVIYLWNLAYRKVSHEFKKHDKPSSSIVVTPDNKFFISASDDGTLVKWDIEKGKVVFTCDDHMEHVYCVSLIPHRNQFISASADHTLRLWDLTTGKFISKLEGHEKSIHSVAVTPDGNHVVSASDDQTLRVWSLASEKCQVYLTGDVPFKRCAISPTGNIIAVGDEGGGIHFIEMRNIGSLK